MVPTPSAATSDVPTPMAPAQDRPEGLVTYSVRGHGHRDVEAGFFSEGQRVVVSFVNADGDLEIR